MTYETKMTKGHDGWTATTLFDIGNVTTEHTTGVRMLEIYTSKRTKGEARSTASAYILSEKSKLMEFPGDYLKTFLRTPIKTATEKAIRAAHDEALKQADVICGQAVAFYDAKKAGVQS